MAIGARYPLLTYLKVEKQSVDKVRSIMLRAAKDLEKQIAALPNKPGIGATVSRLQLEAQRASILSHLRQDFTQVGSVVADGQQMAARAASEVTSRYEETLTKLVADPSTRELIRKSEALRAASNIETIMARQQSSYIPLKDQVYRSGKVAKGFVDKAVDSALARGLTWKEFSKEVRGLIDPATPGGVSYAADRLARTEINNAFHASAAERYEKSGLVTGVDWNLSSSHPEGDECDTFANESPHKANAVPQKPHPFCLCFLTPALPSEDDFFANLMNGDYDDEEWS